MNRDERQAAVLDWVRTTFGPATLTGSERAMRVLEEALELFQAEGLDLDKALAIARHVYGRPLGDPAQEVGGLGVTLLAYCGAKGISADGEEARELERVLAKDPEHFRARHNLKADAGIAAPAQSGGAPACSAAASASAPEAPTCETCSGCGAFAPSGRDLCPTCESLERLGGRR